MLGSLQRSYSQQASGRPSVWQRPELLGSHVTLHKSDLRQRILDLDLSGKATRIDVIAAVEPFLAWLAAETEKTGDFSPADRPAGWPSRPAGS